MSRFFSKVHHSIWLALITVGAHCAYILNHHPYWDGLIYSLFARTGEQSKFVLPWSENGRPVLGSMYWFLIEAVGLEGGLQALVVVCLWLSSLLTYSILRRARWLPEGFSFTAAAIVAVFPALHVHASFTTTFYVILLPLFLFAIRARQAVELENGIRFWVCSIFSIAGLLLSFFSEGLIAASVGIPFLVRFLTSGRFEKPAGRKTILLDLCYFFAPAIFLVAMPRLMPVSGDYRTSRNLSVSAHEILEFVGRYAEELAATPVFFARLYLFLLLAAIVGISIVIYRSKKKELAGRAQLLQLFLLGSLFVFVAALPFILSTRVPGTEGWHARHFTALIFPISIWVTAWIYFWLPARPYAHILSAVVVAGLAFSLIGFQFTWEARAAFDHGIQNKLAASNIRKAGIVYFDKPVESVLSEKYRIYEWNPIFFAAIPDLRRILIASPTELENPEADAGVLVQQAHALVDEAWKIRQKCIVHISIQPTQELTWRQGLHYLIARLTKSADLDSWSNRLSDISFRESGECS